MALIVNNKNVDSYIFIQNDQIKAISKSSNQRQEFAFYLLNCPLRVSNKESEIVNGNKKSIVPESRHTRICSAAISNCNNFIVACDSSNSVHLWKRTDNIFELCTTRNSVRKCQKVIFTNSSKEIILADRGGDVFIFSICEPNSEGKFILGHISFITDIALSSDDKFLISCDRDGKIRVSNYPNCYNIQNYCLGHREFVSSVIFYGLNCACLISGAGDGTVRLWNYNEGKEEVCESMYRNSSLCNAIKMQLHIEISKVSDSPVDGSPSDDAATQLSVHRLKFCEEYNLLAILYHFIKGIAIYKVLDNKLNFIQFLSLPTIAIDALLTVNGDLLVLLKQAPDSLSYFLFDVTTNSYKPFSLDKAPEFVHEVQNFYKNFDIKDYPMDEQMLFKKLFDNDEDECKSKKNKVS